MRARVYVFGRYGATVAVAADCVLLLPISGEPSLHRIQNHQRAILENAKRFASPPKGISKFKVSRV